MTEEKKKSGGCGCLATVFFLVVLALVIYGMSQELTEVQQVMLEPEPALHQYLGTVYHFLHNEKGVNFQNVADLVVNEDMDWFEKNVENLAQDPFNIKGGIDPVDGAVAERIVAFRNVLNGGPTRPDAQIMDKKLGDSVSTFTVKQMDALGGETIYEVKLVKDGRFWKVKDFGGGKQNPSYGIIGP